MALSPPPPEKRVIYPLSFLVTDVQKLRLHLTGEAKHLHSAAGNYESGPPVGFAQ